MTVPARRRSLPLVLIPAAQTTDGYFRAAHTWFSPVWTVRARDRAAATAAIARALQDVDPQLPVSNVRAMDQVIADSMTEQRLLMTLVAPLAGAALLLAAIGVHGVIAHSVAAPRVPLERRAERSVDLRRCRAGVARRRVGFEPAARAEAPAAESGRSAEEPTRRFRAQ